MQAAAHENFSYSLRGQPNKIPEPGAGYMPTPTSCIGAVSKLA
jgi:hypothetical protein